MNNRRRFTLFIIAVIFATLVGVSIGVAAFALNDNAPATSEEGHEQQDEVVRQTDSSRDDYNDNAPIRGNALPDLPQNPRDAFRTEGQLVLPSFRFGSDFVRLLDEAGWDGDTNAIPVSINDFDQEKLDQYAEEMDYIEKGRIGLTLEEEEFYTDPAVVAFVEEEMGTAYDEFIDFIEEKNVHEQYLEELTKVALPKSEETLVYDPESPDSSHVTWIEGKDGNTRKVKLVVTGINLRVDEGIIDQTGIAGDNPTTEDVLRMAVRTSMFHELFHALQQAYINVHMPGYPDVDEGRYFKAEKTLIDIERERMEDWEWGALESTKRVNDKVMSEELQADSGYFEIMTWYLDASPVRAESIWDVQFGRFETASTEMDTYRRLVNDTFPDISPDELGSALFRLTLNHDDFNVAADLGSAANTISAMSSLAGYFNPVQPDEFEYFWEALETV